MLACEEMNPARPRFIVVYQDRRIPLPDGEFVVGRGLGCHIRFNAETVSRQHLKLRVVRGRLIAENLSTTTGTMLNGQRLMGARSISHGDELRCGPRSFRIEVEDTTGAGPVQLSDDYGGDQEEVTMPGSLDGYVPGTVDGLLPTNIEFHTCPQCRAQVAFGNTHCAGCGYTWSGSAPSAVTGRETMRDMLAGGAPVPTEVPVVYSSEELTIDSVVVDLRPNGAFVPSELLDPANAACELTLLPDGIFAMVVAGKVVSVRPVADAKGPAGMEVRFEDVSAQVRVWLERWLVAKKRG